MPLWILLLYHLQECWRGSVIIVLPAAHTNCYRILSCFKASGMLTDYMINHYWLNCFYPFSMISYFGMKYDSILRRTWWPSACEWLAFLGGPRPTLSKSKQSRSKIPVSCNLRQTCRSEFTCSNILFFSPSFFVIRFRWIPFNVF